MASERIINEYDSTRIANAVDTLATNLADYSGTTVTPTDAMKAKLPSQTTADRIADAVETLAENVTSLSDLVRASYEESPALYAHAIDDILYYNNKFYDVTSAIAIGDTLTVSSGLIEGNISERLGGMSYEVFGIPGGGSGGTIIADDISYDNTSSGLTATNVQDAIDELNSKIGVSVTGFTVSTSLTITKGYSETMLLCWGANTAKSVCFIPGGSYVNIEKIISSADAPITMSSDGITITLSNPNGGNVGTLRGFYIKY